MTTRRPLLAMLAGMVVSCLLAVAPPVAAQTTAAAAGHATRRPAPSGLLINRPAASVCVGHPFTVGVWFQPSGRGSRAYRIGVSGPRHVRFFYRHGLAPSSHWLFWKVTPGREGLYRTTYFGHWSQPTSWDAYQFVTRAHRC